MQKKKRNIYQKQEGKKMIAKTIEGKTKTALEKKSDILNQKQKKRNNFTTTKKDLAEKKNCGFFEFF